jgi:maltose alpha-D-glucosyltransferase/alpha-amylase
VIFVDTEPSNWTWDESRGQHYWHRFFSHQPDLNYDCPEVSEAMFEVMSHWLGMGLDGFRLDAVPYLFERDGTNGENLPETHQWLKRLRRRVDDAFPGRVLVAEANQPPVEVVDYFGDADECHMAFHFPLMPRLYKALVDHRAETVAEVLAATPSIPDGCQWGIFLRNHDELTLEMVTEEEREVMYRAYAPEPGMRRNVGIGRRLFPLIDDDRRQAELLHSLLLSLPGSPFLYYGDEIGMGERLELGDRDPVRTPMQWDGSANGGFSAAPADLLYLPSIEEGPYGFPQRNVALDREDPSSFLWWLRNLLASRRSHPAFATGACEVLATGEQAGFDEAVFAYVRAAGEDVVLCVANFADREVTIDASAFEHGTPVVPAGVITGSDGASLEGCGLRLAGYGWAWLHVDPEGSRPDPTGC